MPASNVSVIIPAYNAEAFIADALDSVAAQTCRPREVIVIDDGSTDQTSEIAADWINRQSAAYPTYLLKHQNRGLPATRNVGIRRASGTWIALLDADDVWEANHLQELVQAVKSVPMAVGAYGAGRVFSKDAIDETPYDDYWDNPSKTLGIRSGSTKFLLVDFSVVPRLIKGSFIKPSSLMFSKLVDDELTLFNENFRTAGERDFQIRLLRRGPLVYTPELITRYRWHGQNISSPSNAKANLRNGILCVRAIQKNQSLELGPDELSACSRELYRAGVEYLYLSCQAGLRSYWNGLVFMSGQLGIAATLRTIKLKHIVRCFVHGMVGIQPEAMNAPH